MSPEMVLVWKLRLEVSEARGRGAGRLRRLSPLRVSGPLSTTASSDPSAAQRCPWRRGGDQLGAGGHVQGKRRAAPSAEKREVEFFIDRINQTLLAELATRTQHSTLRHSHYT